MMLEREKLFLGNLKAFYKEITRAVKEERKGDFYFYFSRAFSTFSHSILIDRMI